MEKAARIIHDEHRSISAVLNGLLALAREACKPELRPEFPVLHAMIRYIDQFPERLHHPKEEQYLFARLAERAPEARALVEELRAEHIKGAQLIRDLDLALRDLEVNGAPSAAAFAAAADAYAQFHWDHMRKEEKQLMPLAERAFTPADWVEVNAAFAGNQDPIADLREADFKGLFSRIVSLAPDPVGLASPWQRVH